MSNFTQFMHKLSLHPPQLLKKGNEKTNYASCLSHLYPSTHLIPLTQTLLEIKYHKPSPNNFSHIHTPNTILCSKNKYKFAHSTNKTQQEKLLPIKLSLCIICYYHSSKQHFLFKASFFLQLYAPTFYSFCT